MFVIDGGKRLVVPRTEMAYPGHNPKMHRNAADPVKSPVDHVMADFEDACPYEFKGQKSREVVVEALNTLDFGVKVVTVRPNNVRSKFFIGDLEAIVNGAPNRFHGIVLPKVSGPDDIVHVARLLDTMEREAGWRNPLQIEALIETPRALLRAYDIASASPRMVGLIFGIADFAATLGIRDFVEDQNQNFLYAPPAVHGIGMQLARDEAEEGALARAVRAEHRPALAAPPATPVIYRHNLPVGYAQPEEHQKLIDEATVQVAIADLAKGVQSGAVTAAFLAEQAAKSRQITGYDILDQLRRM